MLRLGLGWLCTGMLALSFPACGGDGGDPPVGGNVDAGGASAGGVSGGTEASTGGAGGSGAGGVGGASGAGAGGTAGTDGTAGGTAGSDGSACDLTGLWIAKRVLFTTPDSPLAPGAQKVSNWDLYEIEQEGDSFTIIEHLFSGLVTTGDARVSVPDDTTRALQERLDQGGRTGTFAPSGDGCALTLERIYIVMGASPIATFRGGVEEAPGRIEGNPELSALEPLPTMGGNPGADDWDGDGKPGVQFVITDSPLGSGLRHDVQRDWHEMSGMVPKGSNEFRVDVTWDFEESVIESTSPFFGLVAVVREGAPHSSFWRRVDDSIRGADDLATAKNVQEAMPHEPLPRDGI